jgi:hypothetical protein
MSSGPQSLDFKIAYLREGIVLTTVEFHGLVEGAMEAAAAGVDRYYARAAHILDCNGQLVGMVEEKQGA